MPTASDATPFFTLMAAFNRCDVPQTAREPRLPSLSINTGRQARDTVRRGNLEFSGRSRLPIDILTLRTRKPTARVDALVLQEWVSAALRKVAALKEESDGGSMV